jgi:hypothetical protein
MSEITVVTMGVGRQTYNVNCTTWGCVKEELGLDTSLEYRLRGELVNDETTVMEYDTFIATKNVKGGF